MKLVESCGHSSTASSIQQAVDKVTVFLERCRRVGFEVRTYERIEDLLTRVAQQGLIHPDDEVSIERQLGFAETLCT